MAEPRLIVVLTGEEETDALGSGKSPVEPISLDHWSRVPVTGALFYCRFTSVCWPGLLN